MPEFLYYVGGGLVAVLGGGGVGAKWMSRRVDNATADGTTVRTMIAAMGRLEAENGRQAEQLAAVSHRLALLEERERHALTRAAVHEAWDQLTFGLMVQHHPDHPPPPPIRELREGSRYEGDNE